MNAKQNLGWIGVGKMGTPMSTNLLKAGYKLTVFDIVPAAMKALVDQNANPAESPVEVAGQADIIISMIPDDTALEEISTGTQGIFQGAKQGMIYIDMSTVSPATSARVSEAAEKKGDSISARTGVGLYRISCERYLDHPRFRSPGGI